MLNHAELRSLASLRTELARLNLPIRLEATGDDVTLHLEAVIDTATEAHLLNVVSHRVRSFRLDKPHGCDLPPDMVRARTAEYIATHPTRKK